MHLNKINENVETSNITFLTVTAYILDLPDELETHNFLRLIHTISDYTTK